VCYNPIHLCGLGYGMAPRGRSLVSVVVPCFNERDAFPHLREALLALHDDLWPDYDLEAVLVDDGSRDDTWDQVRRFAEAATWVRGAALSRNFGHQAALTCGLGLAAGDAVVSLDADLQDPPGVIREMLAAWRDGAEVVYAVRRSRRGESRFKRWTAAAFYRVAKRLGAEGLRADAGDFRLMGRQSLDAVLAMPEQHRFIRGMVGWVGFRTAEVAYDRAPRVAGGTKYSLRKMVALAADAVVSSSTLPLRFPYYFALASSALALAVVASLIAWHHASGEPLSSGWAALMAAVVTFGCLTLCSLGVMGEYLGRIYEQVRGRPLYLVRESVGRPAVRAVAPVIHSRTA
jgi:glycosyltransferase involved in cell wall biosynthesis